MGKPKKRDWTMTEGQVNCFKSKRSMQTVAGLWELGETPFHDAVLTRATKKINSVLDGVKNPYQQDHHLSFITVFRNPFLVWARDVDEPPARGTRSDDPLDAIMNALRISPWFPFPVPPEPDRYWWYLDSKNIMHCLKTDLGSCYIPRLVQSPKMTAWHTDDLAEATKEIQGILDGIHRGGRDSNDEELALCEYDDRLFLAWVEHHGHTADEDTEVVANALRLKAR